jgi:hypothetical protein
MRGSCVAGHQYGLTGFLQFLQSTHNLDSGSPARLYLLVRVNPADAPPFGSLAVCPVVVEVRWRMANGLLNGKNNR